MSLSFSSSPTISTSVRIPLTNVSRPTLLSPKTHRARISETRFDSSTRSDGFGSTLRWISGSPGLTRNRGRSMGVRCEARDDGYYMRRAVELARKALGHTSPNPMVGCVIVRDGEIVGEGFHPKAGQPHGEVFALRDAGDLAENATAYVSLEPCNHYGRTPPCTEALIRAKVKRVVVGMVDPNPIVASKGVERLRESGIDVLVGVEELLCRRLNEAYIHRMTAGKPFVTVRYSLSFSGKILDHLGNGAEESGGYYSQLLQEYDGIVISSNSLVEPFTFPTSNEVGSNQPLQIIISRTVDSSLRLPTSTMQSSSQIVVLTEKATSLEPELKGIRLVVLEKLNFVSILDYCASKGLCSILLDFRGHDDILTGLLEEGLKEHLVQKLMMEVCPVWDRSDETSILAFGGDKLRLRDLQSRISKESIVVEGYLL